MPTFPLPLGNDVIIHPFDFPAKIGSIYVPDTAKKRVNQGIIIAKGPLVSDDVDTADHVFFNGYTGDKLVFEDSSEFYVIPESHLICKVKQSNVMIMDTETIKRIISERFGELRSRQAGKVIAQEILNPIEKSLLDRIDTLAIAEGWEF
jgi:co-chaperonin GroES (HSP10)